MQLFAKVNCRLFFFGTSLIRKDETFHYKYKKQQLQEILNDKKRLIKKLDYKLKTDMA